MKFHHKGLWLHCKDHSKWLNNLFYRILVTCSIFKIVNFACDVTLSVYPHRAGLKNMPDHGGKLAEHWASIPKVVGSFPTMARHIFQACPVWIYTQSNITSILFTWVHYTNTRKYHVQLCFTCKYHRCDITSHNEFSEK
jgi:hypothetical protein